MKQHVWLAPHLICPPHTQNPPHTHQPTLLTSLGKVELAWKRMLDAPIFSSPVVASPVVASPVAVVASAAGTLYALDLRTGRCVWKSKIGAQILCALALTSMGQDMGVVAATQSGQLVCINPASGHVHWSIVVTASALTGVSVIDVSGKVSVKDGGNAPQDGASSAAPPQDTAAPRHSICTPPLRRQCSTVCVSAADGTVAVVMADSQGAWVEACARLDAPVFTVPLLACTMGPHTQTHTHTHTHPEQCHPEEEYTILVGCRDNHAYCLQVCLLP